MGMRTGIRHKLPPSSAGASFSSMPNIPDRELCRPPPLLNTIGKLCQIWCSPDAKALERHHLYRLQMRCVQLTFLPKFRFSNFSILNPMGPYPSIITYLFDILIPVVAHYGPSDTPEPLFRGVLCGCSCLHRCRHILTSGEKILAFHRAATAEPQHLL